MAASCVNKSLALSRIFVKHKEIVKASKRFYTIQPPAWLGGKNVLDIHGKFDFPEHSDSFEERMQSKDSLNSFTKIIDTNRTFIYFLFI